MNVRRIGWLVFTIPFVTILVWYVIPGAHAQQQGNPKVWQRPEKLIDEKARALDTNDEASVRAVADAVFNYPHVVARMPADVESGVKDRLVRAEADFLQERKSGVREEDIVLLVNNVAEKFKLPEFAKTSKKQVRALRMNMVLASPVFMGRGMARGDMKPGESIGQELSPLQATHVLGVLIDQKFLDPNFQVPPEQWDRDGHRKEVERIQERQALLKSNPQVQHRFGTRDNPKRHDLEAAISQGANSISSGDALSLIETAFKTLKIER